MVPRQCGFEALKQDLRLPDELFWKRSHSVASKFSSAGSENSSRNATVPFQFCLEGQQKSVFDDGLVQGHNYHFCFINVRLWSSSKSRIINNFELNMRRAKYCLAPDTACDEHNMGFRDFVLWKTGFNSTFSKFTSIDHQKTD
jgi:hypothetical protein